MTPAQFRVVFRRELERNFRIDEWSLSNPESRQDTEHPPSIARERPIVLLKNIDNPTGTTRSASWRARQGFHYSLVYRLPNRLTSSEVTETYRNPFETMLFGFAGKLVHRPQCVGCTSIEEIRSQVACAEQAQGDYLLIGRIEGVALYEIDPPSTLTCTYFAPQ